MATTYHETGQQALVEATLEQMVNMLFILRDGYKEKGQAEEAAKYEAIVKGILLSFAKEKDENFCRKNFTNG